MSRDTLVYVFGIVSLVALAIYAGDDDDHG